MEDVYFRKIMSAIILISLAALSFFMLRPILLSIVAGFLLAFIFLPIYKKVNKVIKNPSMAAGTICAILILIILLSIWFFTPMALNQSLKFYSAAQQINFVEPLKNIFPSFFSSEEFSSEVGSILNSFVVKTTNYLVTAFADVILNFPALFLKSVVVFFTFFYVLRDREKFIDYVRSILPYPKEVEKKIFNYTSGITSSVLYGQVIIGIMQGLVIGVAFFIFGVSNAFLLTLLATVAGIFPIIGTTIVWIPVAIYLFMAGSNFAAIGIIIFGVVSTNLDNVLRPMIVSQRVKISSSIVIIGMIGGFFLFGILGFILGPLILAYLLIILEIYRKKKTSELFIQEQK
jgi:predicted PurR-regulated permease PerM